MKAIKIGKSRGEARRRSEKLGELEISKVPTLEGKSVLESTRARRWSKRPATLHHGPIHPHSNRSARLSLSPHLVHLTLGPMRRLFGLKSKSSSNSDRPPLEPLSTNTDHRSNGKHSSVKGKQRASSPSQPTSTAAEADTGSLHAHFASPPALVHPLPSPSPLSEPTEGDKGASALVAGSSSGSSRGAGSAGPGSGKVTESRASSAHGTTSSEAGRDQQQRRDSSPAPPVQQQQPNGAALQRTISPLSFVPSQSPYYSAASVGGSVHPSLARVVSSQQHHQDPNAIYGE